VKREFLRFDLEMECVRAVLRKLRQRELLHDRQHLQRADALPVGRHLIDLPTAIVDLQRMIHSLWNCSKSSADSVPPSRFEVFRIASRIGPR
jgi:hypothetical protein